MRMSVLRCYASYRPRGFHLVLFQKTKRNEKIKKNKINGREKKKDLKKKKKKKK